MAHGTAQAILGLGDESDSNSLTALSAADADITALDTRVDQLELDDTVVVLTPGAAVAYDASLGHAATLAMDASATTTVTISNLSAGESCTVHVTQNSAGSKALVFASTFFAGGTEPTMTATASAVDIYTICKFGTQLYGFVAGQDLKT